MNNLAMLADRIQRVATAREDFLMRDFVDRAIIGPMLLDRIAADLRARKEFYSMTHIPSVQSMPREADDR